MKREIGFLTEQGKRDYQQDCFSACTINDITIIVLCDGNGGTGGYEMAQTACKSCIGNLAFEIGQGKYKSIDSEEQLKEIGLSIISRSAREARALKDQTGWPEAGTTITLIIITPKLLGCFWIGDSPAYIFDSEYLVQLNHPVHTLAESMIQEGKPRNEVEKQPGLNSILTRCAGHDNCEPDSNILKVKPPFMVIAGSDGALNYCPKAKLIQTLKKKLSGDFDIDETAFQIVSDALDNGSDDNCSVIAFYGYSTAKLITRRITRIYEPISLKEE